MRLLFWFDPCLAELSSLSLIFGGVMKKLISKYLLSLLLACGLSGLAHAVPASLEGMGLLTQWVDSERTSNDMPDFIWGNSDTVSANRVGIYVEFANGQTGSATYSGVAGLWNTGNFGPIGPDTFTGFFSAAGGLHFLFNTARTNVYPQALPMAWDGFVSPFSNNFDLEYNDPFNGLLSNFRASEAGWDFVTVGVYSSAAQVPEPESLALFGLAVLGLVATRRKFK
jgi:hypothetical protein